jgi:hypothetical protein
MARAIELTCRVAVTGAVHVTLPGGGLPMEAIMTGAMLALTMTGGAEHDAVHAVREGTLTDSLANKVEKLRPNRQLPNKTGYRGGGRIAHDVVALAVEAKKFSTRKLAYPRLTRWDDDATRPASPPRGWCRTHSRDRARRKSSTSNNRSAPCRLDVQSAVSRPRMWLRRARTCGFFVFDCCRSLSGSLSGSQGIPSL